MQKMFSAQALSESSLFISCAEPKEDLSICNQNHIEKWNHGIESILDSLYTNTMLSTFNFGNSSYPKAPLNFIGSKWLQPRKLRNSELSCYFKHISAIKAFLASEFNYALFIEDDVSLGSNCINNVRSILDIYNPEYLDVSDTRGMRIPPSLASCEHNFSDSESQNNIKISKIRWRSSRTSAAYVLSRDFGYKIMDYTKHYILPYDLFLTFILNKSRIDPLWADNVGFIHSSSHGLVSSSIQKQ